MVKDLLRKQLGLAERFPCEGTAAAVEHIGRYKVSCVWLERMRSLTAAKHCCKWISCPAYEHCDLAGFGDNVLERNEAEKLLQAMMDDFLTESDSFNERERIFLEELLSLMETNVNFVPTERQMAWIRSLYAKWVE